MALARVQVDHLVLGRCQLFLPSYERLLHVVLLSSAVVQVLSMSQKGLSLDLGTFFKVDALGHLRVTIELCITATHLEVI